MQRFMYDPNVDSLGRRRPHAKPQPTKWAKTGKVRGIELTDADIAVFLGHNDHGPLPTHYQYEHAKHLRTDYKGHQKRMGLLRNNPAVVVTESGKRLEGTFLHQPAETKRTSVDINALVRDNTELARTELRKRGYWLYPVRTDHMLHRMMNACTTASIRIAASRTDHMGYVTLREIVTRDKTYKRPLTEHPLQVSTAPGKYAPDELYGLSYKEAERTTFLFFLHETDRATEQLDYIEYKFLCILDMLRTKSYRSYWGIPNLYATFVTTKPGRMMNMIALLEKMTKREPELREFFLFKCKPIFAAEWITPPIMDDLVTEPWYRAGLPPFDMTKPI